MGVSSGDTRSLDYSSCGRDSCSSSWKQRLLGQHPRTFQAVYEELPPMFTLQSPHLDTQYIHKK